VAAVRAILFFLVVLALLAWVTAAGVLDPLMVGDARRARTQFECTHGASSVGPVELRNDVVVAGDTTPHTTGCVP
jgi:hypothetical protein